MLSYHNDPAVKDKYVARVVAHREADRLGQGTGWENGRGCAVGCILEAYDCSLYPVELGLPEWLARLEDHLFESLPRKEAMTWAERFLRAVPVGVDVDPVRHRLAVRRLDRLIALQESMIGKHGATIDVILTQVIAALEQMRALHHAEEDGKNCPIESAAWSAAWSAAESAALTARSAAWSAAESAALTARSVARSVAWSAAESAAWSAAWSAAESAESAARSASRSAYRSAYRLAARSAARSAGWSAARSAARSAAWSAAWSAAVKQEADDLLELLAACR